ncbi:YggU family protein [candidate division WOR-1 bacterium RIFOXYB2_FULL_42_35]|uniref:UPF0235 protein A2462_01045 n=1 Tax=candidate division WOR-1 bacterium RIFOXYC2_FULL_41_25 TaxID=1802586 RepID=A0A1F4TN08_UNCSA|nr:MAG: YggU family protein [candidate division WOR-1 bacterium RIFOXYA2_FULL_41_14]OGC24494.1 MAG: YggU family protein [candidate division WOR-1 bacterium RIFOXYB2_FULL_42_35]OGC34111.1 MAG: YggU family protein [candidate division WOR-1 bacterium RIFOXYC2_FULL_41_25]OGC42806.1 MAG: YggU family protein [candidate division WOR-1 bacterium RIFOXYD2_FULL_41_8]
MKKLTIKVIPNAKKNQIIEAAGQLKVKVTAPAVDGKANKALIELLAKHFKVKKNAISIIQGQTSRNKVVTID